MNSITTIRIDPMLDRKCWAERGKRKRGEGGREEIGEVNQRHTELSRKKPEVRAYVGGGGRGRREERGGRRREGKEGKEGEEVGGRRGKGGEEEEGGGGGWEGSSVWSRQELCSRD